MRTDRPDGDTDVLDVHECWRLLRGAQVGRLAVVVDGRPDVFPVNFAVDHGTVVIRTGPGTKLTAALGGGVAFECDGHDVDAGTAWSVVLKGRAELLRSWQDLADTVELPLSPWQGGAKPVFVRVLPDDVTGRRFATVGPEHWAPPGGP
jgi:nitroimidazol reductase NimA-like FMN-containing flavoprotein (pyridoxamine 5'-phosphate oxidase superfamily)